MSTIIAITLSVYILGCIAAFSINLYDAMRWADEYPDILAGIVISLICCPFSWIAVGAYIYSKIKKKHKHGK